MLSDTFGSFRGTDENRMRNLCRGIARIMLSFSAKHNHALAPSDLTTMALPLLRIALSFVLTRSWNVRERPEP
jgi:hypothetical protein